MEDGGPAFAHGDPTNGGHPGMSLRDYIAAQVAGHMVRRCVNLEDWGRLPWTAYKVADAMLTARASPSPRHRKENDDDD